MKTVVILVIIILFLAMLMYRAALKAVCMYIKENGFTPDEATIKKYTNKVLKNPFLKF